jgi:hypothetical protein
VFKIVAGEEIVHNNIAAFLKGMSRQLSDTHQSFGGTYCYCLHGRIKQMETAGYSEALALISNTTRPNSVGNSDYEYPVMYGIRHFIATFTDAHQDGL